MLHCEHTEPSGKSFRCVVELWGLVCLNHPHTLFFIIWSVDV